MSFVFVLILFACSSNDSSSVTTESTITLNMNGGNITATLIEVRLIKSSGTNEKLLEIIIENNDYKLEIDYFLLIQMMM